MGTASCRNCCNDTEVNEGEQFRATKDAFYTGLRRASAIEEHELPLGTFKLDRVIKDTLSSDTLGAKSPIDPSASRIMSKIREDLKYGNEIELFFVNRMSNRVQSKTAICVGDCHFIFEDEQKFGRGLKIIPYFDSLRSEPWVGYRVLGSGKINQAADAYRRYELYKLDKSDSVAGSQL